MINKSSLVGNLVRDPELRVTGSGMAVCNMTIAIDRDGQKDKTDFPNIIVWSKTAENCAKYLTKGSKIAVTGEIQTGSYKNSNGDMKYTTDVLAHRVEFLNTTTGRTEKHEEDFESRPDFEDFQSIEDDDDDVPF